MIHLLLLAAVPVLTQGDAEWERAAVTLRYPYPAKPPSRQAKEWGEFIERWGPPPPWEDFGPLVNHTRVDSEHWEGTVVTIDPAFIEVRKKGEREGVKYPAHYLLSSGRVVPWVSDLDAYLLDDVKKGDEVLIKVGTADKEKGEECFTVRILKRPGGTVPAPRKLTNLRLYHRDRQAEIDHEEKGTPLPEHLQRQRRPFVKAPPTAPKPSDRTEATIPDRPTPKSEAVIPEELKKDEKELKATPPKKDDKK
jgi:hypothetical protein